MQPVRVIIAAIFFVIGALIVIPAFTGGNSSSDAADTPSPTATATGTATPTGTKTAGTPTKSTSKTPTRTPTRTPTPTATPTHPAVPTKTATPTAAPTKSTPVPPVLPTPSKTTSAPPAGGLTVSFGAIDCPAKEITVKVTNEAATGQGYSITRNGSLVLADQLGTQASRTSEVALTEDKTVVVRVTQDGKTIRSHSYKLNCKKAGAKPSKSPDRLPMTGSDTGTLIARLATGAASIVTGAIILWWGGLWPRRRDHMFGGGRQG